MSSTSHLLSFTTAIGRDAFRDFFRPVGAFAGWIRCVAELPGLLSRHDKEFEEIRLKQDAFRRSLLELMEAVKAIQASTEQVQSLQTTLLSLTREYASAKKLQSHNVGHSLSNLPEVTLYSTSLRTLTSMEGLELSHHVTKGFETISYSEALPAQVNLASLQRTADQLSRVSELLQQQIKSSPAVVELTVSTDIKHAK